ncbi:molybdopterin-guanine dinucleotide biosynthesis protein A [Methanophagales archaeon]|nr:molybdopterin-guanine dinucleotide biosynthesis protein A [Methanophagales archaeon]
MQKTILILAGGQGRRFHSFDKCFASLDNKLLIQHAIDNISGLADEIIVAARDEQQGEQIRARVSEEINLAFDSLNGFGPLAGFLSGLEQASFAFSLVIGCDMPFVNKSAVNLLFEIASSGYDAVVPRWENGMLEPLHAVYRRDSILAAIRDAVKTGDGMIYHVISQLKNVCFLPVNRIRVIDPNLKTFQNINTPFELKKSEKFLCSKR